MRSNAIKPKGWIVFSLLVLLTAMSGIVCLLSLPPGWIDSTGQFVFGTEGHLQATLFAAPGNFSGVIDQSNSRHLEPPGFSVLLHLWKTISSTPFWLRLLPFIGFLGMAATAYRILRCSEVPVAEAILLTSLFASSPLLFPFAAQMRPYSFGAWGTLYVLSVLYRYTPQRTALWKFTTGLSISFFLWMRYPFWIAAGVAATLLFFKILLKKDRRLWLHFVLFLLPQLISAVLIYMYSLRFQDVSGRLHEFARATNVQDQQGFSVLWKGVFYYGAVVAFFAVLPFRERFKYPIHLGRFGLFTALLFLSWNLFSYFAGIPANPATHWAIGLNVTALMCLFIVLSVLLFYVPGRSKPLFYVLLATLALFQPLRTAWAWYRGTSFCNPAVHVDAQKLFPDKKTAVLLSYEKLWNALPKSGISGNFAA